MINNRLPVSLIILLGVVMAVGVQPGWARVSESEFQEIQKAFNDAYSKAPNAGERAVAIRKLGEADHPGVVETIVKTVIPKELKENELLMLDIIAITLGKLTDANAIKSLIVATRQSQSPGGVILINGLARINITETQTALVKLIPSSDPFIKIAAIDALANPNPPEALDKVIDALNNKSWEVNASAINYLGRVKDDAGKQKAIEALQKRLTKEKGRLATDIADAIRNLSKVETPAQDDTDKDKNMTAAFFDVSIDSDVVFVLDLSPSMDKGYGKEGITRIEMLRRELKNTIEMMAKSIKPLRFNIIVYSDKVQRWQDNLVPVKEYKDKAIKLIDEFKLGAATNMYDALETALTGATAQKAIATSGMLTPYSICLMSDGMPNWGKYKGRDEILGAVKILNQTRKIKINTIALGVKINSGPMGTPDTRLMRQLAEDNGGVYKEF